MKVVNLSVHKNNLAQRQRKQSRKTMITTVKGMASTDCVEGFYFISWDKNGSYQDRLHDPKGIVGKSSLSAFVAGSATRTINEIDNED